MQCRTAVMAKSTWSCTRRCSGADYDSPLGPHGPKIIGLKLDIDLPIKGLAVVRGAVMFDAAHQLLRSAA